MLSNHFIDVLARTIGGLVKGLPGSVRVLVHGGQDLVDLLLDFGLPSLFPFLLILLLSLFDFFQCYFAVT